MSPIAIVIRLLLCVLLCVGAVVVLAWFRVVHGDVAGGVAAAMGLGLAGWLCAPGAMAVGDLVVKLQKHNEQNS